MFCKNCGKELADEVIFCPVCGTRKMEVPIENKEDKEQERNAEPKEWNAKSGPAYSEPEKSVSVEGNKEQEKEKLKNEKSDKPESDGNIISKIWNSPIFTKAAIKFGNILEILEGILFLILSRALFKEGGFFGVIFGIILALGGLGSCISGILSLLSRRKKNDENEVPDETAINKKKRNLCIGIVVIVIALVVVVNTGGGTYSSVKAISFEEMGPETIGELVDKNIKSPEWSQKKLDSSSKLVYVEGYCPSYGETIKIEFYYEKTGDGSYEVSLSKMYWPDSNEEFGIFEAAIVWATFYQ